jgi:nicotinamide riboside kinase
MKILVTGPECSGKTTLAQYISQSHGYALVTEMARPYLELRPSDYDYQSLHEIALCQYFEQMYICNNNENVVCDTDLLTIIIWGKEVFGKYEQQWLELWQSSYDYDYIFLCRPDMTWEADKLRENEHDRDRLFDIYANHLVKYGKSFVVLEGDHQHRVQWIIKWLK